MVTNKLNKIKKIKNLFLRQSYLDSYSDYESSLTKIGFVTWDYVILTASNEEQAENYQAQIEERRRRGLLPEKTVYQVLPDPDGKRVGSGGATLHVLKYIAQREAKTVKTAKTEGNIFAGKRILVIHSGGDSKRVPQYSACGKLFSPVPRELPNGRVSTLFDEFVIGMSGLPSRIQEGMLVLSGDVLLLFNPLQIDAQFHGAAAISMKEPVDTGKNHGVFLGDGKGNVKCFLHKQSEDMLQNMGAIDRQGNVDLDTGAVLLDANLTNALFSLISSNGVVSEEKFATFVNEKARISFYGDFLYPLAKQSTLEQYRKENPEGEFCPELDECRRQIWQTIKDYSLKLICVSPSEFIHFGTTQELLQLVTEGVEDYEFLDWKKFVMTNASEGKQSPCYAMNNAFISEQTRIGSGSYIENSMLEGSCEVGKGSVVSNIHAVDWKVPSEVVVHGLRLKDDNYVVRIFGTMDNPKGCLEDNAAFLGTSLEEFLFRNSLTERDIWKRKDEMSLWNARMYPVCETMQEGIVWAELLCNMAEGKATDEQILRFQRADRESLSSSFNGADVMALIPWQKNLTDKILTDQFLKKIDAHIFYEEALLVYGEKGIDQEQFAILMEEASCAEFSRKIRIYYSLARYAKKRGPVLNNNFESLEALCFETIQNSISQAGEAVVLEGGTHCIARNQVRIELPVRVNWGGGWTDTPPYCNEQGGAVLNAAITLNNTLPVQVVAKRLPEYHLEFESEDVGVRQIFTEASQIQDCHNPFDHFAIHKAAFIACGLLPAQGEADLQEILRSFGGGIYLSTSVVGVPKGSGLGTSSILSGACVKALFALFEEELEEEKIYELVLSMEQMMSTGGGWQDQVGGIARGIKLIRTRPGLHQHILVEPVMLQKEALEELQTRFALIYTGQRRLARNLLREVVGGYIGSREQSVEALKKMEQIAVLMSFALEKGDIDEFAHLLKEHWELSKQLDEGTTNTCIDQILASCEELVDGYFIAGAGGGGFLQVIMKKGVTRSMLRERLHSIFAGTGVGVWECSIMPNE